jgi:hypothetical protein
MLAVCSSVSEEMAFSSRHGSNDCAPNKSLSFLIRKASSKTKTLRIMNDFDAISGDDFLTSSDMYMNMNQDGSYYSTPSLSQEHAIQSPSTPTAHSARSNIPPSLLIGGSASPQEFAAMPSPYMESPYTADAYTSEMQNMMLNSAGIHSAMPSSPFFSANLFGLDTIGVSTINPSPEYSPS